MSKTLGLKARIANALGTLVLVFTGCTSVQQDESQNTNATSSAAIFRSPFGVAVDSAGNVFVTEFGNHAIRKVSADGLVTTLAGSVENPGSTDGNGSEARFYKPSGVTVDRAGNVFVADSGNHTIRKVSAEGIVTTLAGSVRNDDTNRIGMVRYFSGIDGTGREARFCSPYGVAVDSAGNVYVTDTNDHTIRKVNAAGVVTTLAGKAGNSGSADGMGEEARFNQPYGVAVDSTGNLFVMDYDNHMIRKVSQAGVVTTLAGSVGKRGSADGTGSAARFSFAFGIAADSTGNVFVADTVNNTIRKVTPRGVVITLAGNAAVKNRSGFRKRGGVDGTGKMARFDYPQGIAVDSAGNVLVADYENDRIRKVSPTGVVTTLAGRTAATASER